MRKLLISLGINAVALFAAVALVDGIIPQSDTWVSYIWLAVIFGLVNAFLKPVLKVVGCPFIILTLGLGAVLINTLLFYLAGQIGTQFNVGFTVENFWAALLGAIIVSVVSFFLNIFLKDEKEDKKDR
jgi:putative membrane protein